MTEKEYRVDDEKIENYLRFVISQARKGNRISIFEIVELCPDGFLNKYPEIEEMIKKASQVKY